MFISMCMYSSHKGTTIRPDLRSNSNRVGFELGHEFGVNRVFGGLTPALGSQVVHARLQPLSPPVKVHGAQLCQSWVLHVHAQTL